MIGGFRAHSHVWRHHLPWAYGAKIEAILPPTLSGIGHKLRTPWFHEVLTKGGKSRSWMSLRMPQFGEAQVGKLPQTIAALEGTTTDDAIHHLKLTTEMIQTGRQLIGKDKGYGCITCHDIAGMSFAVDESCGIKIPLRGRRTSILEFADAIARLVTTQGLLNRLSEGSLRRAKAFTWDEKVREIANAYDAVPPLKAVRSSVG